MNVVCGFPSWDSHPPDFRLAVSWDHVAAVTRTLNESLMWKGSVVVLGGILIHTETVFYYYDMSFSYTAILV